MGNYLRKMKFTAIALLATTAQATDAFLCGNWTVETFTDKTCVTNDTNSTHTVAGTAWGAQMTTSAVAWANCTQVQGSNPVRYHTTTCNKTHYTLLKLHRWYMRYPRYRYYQFSCQTREPSLLRVRNLQCYGCRCLRMGCQGLLEVRQDPHGRICRRSRRCCYPLLSNCRFKNEKTINKICD